MKWKNIDVGACYYYVTATCTEWLPILNNPDARTIVCMEIGRALDECEGFLSAYVVMPDHVHLLAYLPDGNVLHRFNGRWRGRSGRKIVDLAKSMGATKLLATMAEHANGKAEYAAWKEQTRDLAIWEQEKLHAKVDYIHANPVRRGLGECLGDWTFSSWRFYETGEIGVIDVVPLRV